MACQDPACRDTLQTSLVYNSLFRLPNRRIGEAVAAIQSLVLVDRPMQSPATVQVEAGGICSEPWLCLVHPKSPMVGARTRTKDYSKCRVYQ